MADIQMSAISFYNYNIIKINGDDRINVCLLIYDGFCHMEVSTALYLLHEHSVFSTALEDRVYVSEEKLRYVPEKIIGQFSAELPLWSLGLNWAVL